MRRSTAIGPQFIQYCSLIGPPPSSACLALRFRVPPLLTHTHTRTNSLYFCYTAASGAENKKSRFVLACFLPLLPLSSVLSPLCLSFYFSPSTYTWCLSLPHSRLPVLASLSSPPMRCVVTQPAIHNCDVCCGHSPCALYHCSPH